MLTRVVSAVLLCGLATGAAFAAEDGREVIYKASGTEAGAFLRLSTDDGGYVELSVAPTISADNKNVYRVDYLNCDPSFACSRTTGLVSSAAVTRAGNGMWAPMMVNISRDSFVDDPGIDPGILVGTFSIYPGPNSQSSTMSGSSSSEQVLADGTKLTLSFSGHQVQSTATFRGIIRSSQVVTPPNPLTVMFVQKGITRQTRTPAR